MDELLIPEHGGYRRLKTFIQARLIYDATLRFCERYIDRRSRTFDQMVQAARSGVQNIAEGSVASGTSRKSELKLTNVARASLEELLLDYEDFLRQHALPIWADYDPRRRKIAAVRLRTMEDLHRLLADPAEWEQAGGMERSANAMTALITVTCYLLDRQLKAQERKFLQEGGFTERLYHLRKKNRIRDDR